MNIALHLKIVGALQLLLAFSHIFFPRRFGWKEDCAKLTLLNRQIFFVHAFFITLVLALFGLLSVLHSDLLLRGDELSRLVLAGLVVFWLARLFIQFFVYDSQLWRGHRFNTTTHIFFSLMWIYYVATYAAALYYAFVGREA
jgi:hypothetical protein